MNPSADFENVLAACLDQVVAQPGDVEAVLAQYPQWANELRPLLESALWISTRAVSLNPRPGFVAASRQRLVNEIRKPVARISWSEKIFGTWHKELFVPVLATFVLFFFFFSFKAGQSLSKSAASALPGDRLYPVKTALEDAQLAASWTKEGDARLYMQFASRRVDEIEQLLLEGETGHIQEAVARYERQVRPAIELTEDVAAADPEQGVALTAWTANMLAEQADGLAMIANFSPAVVQPDLEQIMAVNLSGRETVQEIIVTQEATQATGTPTPTLTLTLTGTIPDPDVRKQPSQTPSVAATTHKPEATPKPANTNKPPTHTAKPTETVKVTKEAKPTATVKPTKTEKPTSTIKPTDEPKPTKEEKPTDEPKPTKEEKPTDEPKPTQEEKATKEPKP